METQTVKPQDVEFTVPADVKVKPFESVQPCSEHFTFSELVHSDVAEKYGIINECPTRYYGNLRLLLHYLEVIRHEFNKPIKITSGYRCQVLNDLVNGVIDSAHTYGRAADITSSHLMELYSVVKKLRFDNVYSYVDQKKNYIHFEYRPL